MLYIRQLVALLKCLLVYRTVSTNAMEVLLDVSPLDIELEVASSYAELQDTNGSCQE